MAPRAPIAVADPVWPSAGDQSASATIEDLEAQGYNVQINWVNGNITQPLSQCSVSAIHNPNRSAEPPETFTTVYVDVSCPDYSDDFDLGTNLWIVFAGRFDNQESAERQAGNLAERYPGAYATLVKPAS